jgi:hypothetical protein
MGGWVVGRHLHIEYWYLLCVINPSHTFRLTFFKPCTVVTNILKMCMWLSKKCSDIFRKIYMKLNLVDFPACFDRQCFLCIINSSHTFRLTFFKLCTVVMDKLKICIWHFESVQSFFKKFTCSWALGWHSSNCEQLWAHWRWVCDS